jgi:hypothetical protein
MSNDIVAAPPAMYEHCLRVYGTMETEAQYEDVPVEGDGEAVSMKVWTGALTAVFRRLDLSTPYYTHVMQHLKRMGCVEQYKRGGGGTPSKWVLYGAPTPDLFETAVGPTSGAGTPSTRLEAVEQQLRDQQKTINMIAKALKIQF